MTDPVVEMAARAYIYHGWLFVAALAVYKFAGLPHKIVKDHLPEHERVCKVLIARLAEALSGLTVTAFTTSPSALITGPNDGSVFSVPALSNERLTSLFPVFIRQADRDVRALVRLWDLCEGFAHSAARCGFWLLWTAGIAGVCAAIAGVIHVLKIPAPPMLLAASYALPLPSAAFAAFHFLQLNQKSSAMVKIASEQHAL